MFKNLFNCGNKLIFPKTTVKYEVKFAKMHKPVLITGEVKAAARDLNLDLTLLGGQSFRWHKVENEQPEWHGVAFGTYWVLQQNANVIEFQAYPSKNMYQEQNLNAQHFALMLSKYLRLDFDLTSHLEQWKTAHKHFANLSNNLKAVRVLDQEPLENIISFICSQNNNIKRISTMIDWLCATYGNKIGAFHGGTAYAFPTLEVLSKENELESSLRAAKFGYRAKFIAQSVQKISEHGGLEWFAKLRKAIFDEARLELVTLPGIGFKVADCICLMSLNHLEAVPIDTHIFQVAQREYMPELAAAKSVTPKIYDDVAKHFRKVYGEYAGWAQTVLFCAELPQFQSKTGKSAQKKMAKKPRK